MAAYYNEIDPAAAHILRAMIDAGVIAPGDVDERSIKEVNPDDLIGYTQCHFFAGGGLWSVAARLADWPDDEPLWTASCPCQPFSAAGTRTRRARGGSMTFEEALTIHGRNSLAISEAMGVPESTAYNLIAAMTNSRECDYQRPAETEDKRQRDIEYRKNYNRVSRDRLRVIREACRMGA
ncbi:DNA cytosine methyltransferase [Pararhizobium antarcticum]|nr:DNA cytosine methyltransferase [Pararhizobium antarcticum]